MRKKKAVDILEEDDKPTEELPLIQARGKEFKVLPTQRTSSSRVIFDPKVVKKETEGKKYTFLHTHPRIGEDTQITDPLQLLDENDKKMYEIDPALALIGIKDLENNLRYAPSFPSTPDILSLLKYEEMEKSIIAQRDPVTGKVHGYFFLRKTKKTPKFPEYPQEETEEEITRWENQQPVKKFERLAERLDYLNAEYSAENNQQAMQDQKNFEKIARTYSLQLRYVPVKGYEFRNGRFVKKKEARIHSELEHKIAAVIATIGFIGSLLVSTSSITGNTIAHLSQERINLLSILLFLIGIIATFIFLRNKRTNKF